MKLKFFASLLALSALALPCNALDLTPRYKDVADRGGWVTKRLYFTDGPDLYTLTPGYNANMASEGNTLRFTFDELESSTLLIRISPFTPELTFVEENLGKYRESLLTYLPPGVTEVTVVNEQENPIAVNDSSSHRFEVSCKLPGSALRVTITFINLNKNRQLVVVTTAYGEVFKAAQKRSDEIVTSLRLITEEELSTPAST